MGCEGACSLIVCDERCCRFADILRCRETILPLVFGALVHNTRGEHGNGGHWSTNVEMLSFVRLDSDAFLDLSRCPSR